jgi:23S rRNA pseudouridine1911/1915/1917 synthase
MRRLVIAISEPYQFIVEESGIRLDVFVSGHCPDLSRTRAQKIIEDGRVRVNGAASRSALKLREGDSVEVVIPPPPPSTLSPEDIPLKILYEDRDLMVVDKPAGMTVHPAPGHHSHTLVNAILAHAPDIEAASAEAGGESGRPGIVHRLDKDTSGLILVARNAAAHAKLAEQFKNRSITKFYQALVQGHLTPEEGIIEASIGRDPRDRKRMAVITRGREARTEYKVLEYAGNCTLLEVKPRTGRTHQIRVHLAAIGFPIVGDAVYGARSEFLDRQFLHACRLRFRLPSTGELREFESPLPPDLTGALANIAGKSRK